MYMLYRERHARVQSCMSKETSTHEEKIKMYVNADLFKESYSRKRSIHMWKETNTYVKRDQ